MGVIIAGNCGGGISRYGQNEDVRVLQDNIVDITSFTSRTVEFDYTKQISGIGSYSISEINGLQINTGTQAGSGVDFISKNLILDYMPTGFTIRMAVNNGGVNPGNLQEWGIFDDNYGLFIRCEDGNLSFVSKFGGNETVIPAAVWQKPKNPDAQWHVWEIKAQFYMTLKVQVYRDRELVFTGTDVVDSAIGGIPRISMRFKNHNTTSTDDNTFSIVHAEVSFEGSQRRIFEQPMIFSKRFDIGNKDGINTFRVDPFFIQENNAVITGEVSNINGGNTDMLQIFRAKKDNLKAVGMVLSATPLTTQVLNCDTTTGWNSTTARIIVSADSVIKMEGAASIKTVVDSPSAKANSAYYTYGVTQDWSAVVSLIFDWRQSRPTLDTQYQLVIEDNAGNSKYIQIPVGDINTWESKSVDLEDFIENQGTPTDMGNISILRVLVEYYGGITEAWIDDVKTSIVADLGDFGVEIYDFGTNPNPTSLGTPISSTTVNIQSIPARAYIVDSCGCDLVVGNYYGLVITNPSVADVQIGWVGNNSFQSYKSGKSFYSDDDGLTLVELTDKSFAYSVYAREECEIHEMTLKCQSNNQSFVNVFLSSADDDSIYEIVIHDNYFVDDKQKNIIFNNNQFQKLQKDIEIVCYFNDDGDINNRFVIIECLLYKRQIDVYG